MVFSSITFMFFFFPIVVLLYFGVASSLKAKNVLLFVASLVFYAWGNPFYVILMLFSIVANYWFASFIDKAQNDAENTPPPQPRSSQLDGNSVKSKNTKAKLLLAFCVIVNIALLCAFKYTAWFVKIINSVIHTQFSVPNITLPIGISFYTFQALSYVIDVYRKKILCQRNMLKLGLYIAFFPQLVAGPIVRYSDIENQLDARQCTSSDFVAGLERVIIGLAKKTLIANVLAKGVDGVLALDFASYGASYAWLMAIGYSLQIYYDFSGYSDMAIGMARMFGFHFLENFNYPYAARGIKDFWRRWHISLSSWFKDYLYIPLGGNRKGKARTILNRYIVFFLTGMWHGAGFNFILWGLGHGTLLTIENAISARSKNDGKNEVTTKNNDAETKPFARATPENQFLRFLKILLDILWRIATLVCVILLWVFFRTSTKDGIKIVLKMFGINYTHFASVQFVEISNFMPALNGIFDARFFITLAVGVIFSFPWWRKIKIKSEKMQTALVFVKYAALFCLLVFSCATLASGAYNPFIYFRF